ncbi:hypothetical protein DFH09DRAFT_1081698 [Mycena vulgaris]|nr:hypothetical protein DFH09DRAFT_1081698 [Mycena vulgaris]
MAHENIHNFLMEAHHISQEAQFIVDSPPNAEHLALYTQFFQVSTTHTWIKSSMAELLTYVQDLLCPLDEFLLNPPPPASTHIPRNTTGRAGHPCYVLDLNRALLLHYLGNTWEDIAQAMVVVRKTLYNQMESAGRSTARKEWTYITDEALDQQVAEISLAHPFIGSAMILLGADGARRKEEMDFTTKKDGKNLTRLKVHSTCRLTNWTASLSGDSRRTEVKAASFDENEVRKQVASFLHQHVLRDFGQIQPSCDPGHFWQHFPQAIHRLQSATYRFLAITSKSTPHLPWHSDQTLTCTHLFAHRAEDLVKKRKSFAPKFHPDTPPLEWIATHKLLELVFVFSTPDQVCLAANPHSTAGFSTRLQLGIYHPPKVPAFNPGTLSFSSERLIAHTPTRRSAIGSKPPSPQPHNRSELKVCYQIQKFMRGGRNPTTPNPHITLKLKSKLQTANITRHSTDATPAHIYLLPAPHYFRAWINAQGLPFHISLIQPRWYQDPAFATESIPAACRTHEVKPQEFKFETSTIRISSKPSHTLSSHKSDAFAYQPVKHRGKSLRADSDPPVISYKGRPRTAQLTNAREERSQGGGGTAGINTRRREVINSLADSRVNEDNLDSGPNPKNPVPGTHTNVHCAGKRDTIVPIVRT